MKTAANIIYGLYDPPEKGGELRYIGQSSIGLTRVKQHKKPGNLKAKSYKVNWINSLIKHNMMYESKVILDLGEFSSNQERDAALNKEEIRLIAEHKALGARLTNSTDGGEGTRGNVLSQESKNLIGQKQKDHIAKHGLSSGFLKQIQMKPKKEIDGIPHKHCSDCDTFKPLSEYHNYKQAKDGFRSICKPCALSRVADHRKNNPTGLTDKEWQQSYDDRKVKMTAGVKAAIAADPDYSTKRSKLSSKPVIGTSVSTPNKTLEFPSALVAYNDAGYNNTYISTSIKTGKPYKGYYWSFKK